LEEEKRLNEEANAIAINEKKTAILNLRNKGMNISEIALVFNISREAVNNYLSEK